MKILRIPLIIALLVLAGRTFDAGAQIETNLYSFVGYPTDGDQPQGTLVQGSDGNFYGTTWTGGNGNGNGNVFRINSSGSYTSLYFFGSVPADGEILSAGLVQGSDGNFYGTTYDGGTSTNCIAGCGTVFRIAPGGTYTNLYSFGSQPGDGVHPEAGLVQGSDGNFYGTTGGGGTNNTGNGTVFRISSSGAYTSLYSFVGSPNDGSQPYGGLVQGYTGYFYGTTHVGGANGVGTVFLVTPSGYEMPLYSFGSIANDGYYPVAGLAQGSDGNFYGTTSSGGTNGYAGTVFRISPSGSYTSLYSFVGSPTDGTEPSAGLMQGSDGNFYGTTFFGGAGTNSFSGGYGTVFQISPSGTETTLYSFVGSPTDGNFPFTGLVQGSDGNFYGTTTSGGTSMNCQGGCGIVFRFSVPLNPPANQISRIAKIQTLLFDSINISIPSVAGETYQLQFRTDLTSGIWSNVPNASVTNSLGGLLTLDTNTGANQPQGFYRFDITP